MIVEGIGQLRKAVNRVTVAYRNKASYSLKFDWKNLIKAAVKELSNRPRKVKNAVLDCQEVFSFLTSCRAAY